MGAQLCGSQECLELSWRARECSSCRDFCWFAAERNSG
ncbi:pentatricopeptide repeat-containing protein, mitochondrial isoform X1 [Iris pallida]|nr:pentatricopeptide repeat-containing protein, mitochondrial isoform X1 [Iris pallida]